MERLEAAIKKARGQQGQVPAASSAARTTRAVPTAVDDAWGTLPEMPLDSKALKRNRVITLDPTPEATAFDVLRTRTLRHLQDNGWRRLAITSPTPGCGKSTLSLNIALSLSRQHKLHTVSVEMDMRRPSQERLLGLRKKSERGGGDSAVARLMTGKTGFSDVARRVNRNLALVTNSHAQTNASDILLDDHVGQVLSDIEAQYRPDVMIFDMPPVLLTDDTLAFMQHVDCAMIVAAAETTTVAEIDRCERELAAHTNVMGVVLNKCRIAAGGYGSYEYRYGGYGY